MPLVALVALLTSPASAPTIEEVRKNMHVAARELRGYMDAWEVTTSKDAEQKVRFFRWLNGEKVRQDVHIGGSVVASFGHDGKNAWFIQHPEKKFGIAPMPNTTFTDAYEPFDFQDDDEEPSEGGKMALQFTTPYDLTFASKPDFELLALEDAEDEGKPVRKMTARASQTISRFLDLELTLERDRWLPLRLEIKGKSEADEFTIKFHMIRRDLENKPEPNWFELDRSKVAGYEEVPPNADGDDGLRRLLRRRR